MASGVDLFHRENSSDDIVDASGTFRLASSQPELEVTPIRPLRFVSFPITFCTVPSAAGKPPVILLVCFAGAGAQTEA